MYYNVAYRICADISFPQPISQPFYGYRNSLAGCRKNGIIVYDNDVVLLLDNGYKLLPERYAPRNWNAENTPREQHNRTYYKGHLCLYSRKYQLYRRKLGMALNARRLDIQHFLLHHRQKACEEMTKATVR